MRKMAILLMVITILTKITGFLRDITLSFFYGASALSDAYIISVTITGVLFSLVFTGISTGYIAMFNQIELEIGEKSTKRFTNNLINIVIMISTVLIILGFCFSELLVRIFAFGFDEETMKIAISLTRIGLIGICFTSLTQLFVSHLQLKGKFAVPAMIGLPYNLLLILSIYISVQTNILFLAVGTILATISQLLLLVPSLYLTNYRYEPILDLKDKSIRKMAFYIYPIMLGMSIDNINLMVDKTLASRIIEGGISSLEYASRLNSFVQDIFVLSFVTVMFPLISKMAANKNTKDFKKTINEVLTCVLILVIPVSIGIMILAEPIIKLLYGRGSFDEQAILLTSQALFFYSIGMIGYAIRDVLLRTFYSLQDMKTPMYNVSIALILNIILNLVLSRFMGISGLALATSISALFSAVLLLVSLRKKIGSLELKNKTVSLLKVIFASIVMGLAVFIFNGYMLLDWNGLFKMGVVVFLGFAVYVILLILLRVPETQILINFLWNRINPSKLRQ